MGTVKTPSKSCSLVTDRAISPSTDRSVIAMTKDGNNWNVIEPFTINGDRCGTKVKMASHGTPWIDNWFWSSCSYISSHFGSNHQTRITTYVAATFFAFSSAGYTYTTKANNCKCLFSTVLVITYLISNSIHFFTRLFMYLVVLTMN